MVAKLTNKMVVVLRNWAQFGPMLFQSSEDFENINLKIVFKIYVAACIKPVFILSIFKMLVYLIFQLVCAITFVFAAKKALHH